MAILGPVRRAGCRRNEESSMEKDQWQSVLQGLPKFLGMTLTHVTKDRLVAELTVHPDICADHHTIHGGAIMAFADTLGAIATVVNLREGQGTTTLESKTNFFAPSPLGTRLIAECVPLHRGKRTQVWETRLTREDGRLVAKVTQTQMVLENALP
jgi:uncharacterized protein (TIGR00369 family)